jgi:hypothetical protein
LEDMPHGSGSLRVAEPSEQGLTLQMGNRLMRIILTFM